MSLEQWENKARAFAQRLTALLGPVPDVPSVMRDECINVSRVGRLTVEERNVWWGQERIPLLVLYDDAGRAPRSAVICIHGHHGNRYVLAGLANTTEDEERIRRFGYDYARQLAEAGFLTVAYDLRGFGERPFALNPKGHDPCDMEFLRLMLTGRTLLGLHVWDLRRVIDYLETRPDVRPGAIGCVGFSLGGTIALYGGALDRRLKAVGVFSALNHYTHYAIGAGHFCGAQVVPGLLPEADLPDVASLIAPRALWIEHGDADETFSVNDALLSIEEVAQAYRRQGVGDQLGTHVFHGGHRFELGESAAFFKRVLGEGREGS
ncbi:MAG: alpha/beta fold hydrolase [Firmicutes bacterium]|nr:alpha/beta fold hydrolase [Bacillota bacterium]